MTSGTTGKPKTITNPAVSLPLSVLARDALYPYAAGEVEREAVNAIQISRQNRLHCPATDRSIVGRVGYRRST